MKSAAPRSAAGRDGCDCGSRKLAGAGDRARSQRAQDGYQLARELAGLQTSAERLAHRSTALSDGRIKITVYPADSLVRAFEVFDAVSAGVADMYHIGEAYFERQVAGVEFLLCTVPYGLTADELCSWIAFGGGQALWDEVDAQFNIKPLDGRSIAACRWAAGSIRKSTTRRDFKGLRYRMPGLGAEVLRRMGATVVTTPGGRDRQRAQIRRNRRREWVGPWLDMASRAR